jgi:hypothetical protein
VSSTTVFENVESCKKEDEKHILFAWHARAARLLRSPSPTRQMSRLLATCAACAAAYFAWVLSVVAPHAPRLFAPRFGRGHRLAGAAHLVLLLVGVADLLARVSQASFGASARPPLDLVALPLGRARVSGAFLYDALLGVSGCALTITAASDFGIPRARLRNRASGALDDDQTVTREEIVEHLFYQVLNVTQMVFLRLAPIVAATHGRSGACASLALATAPWLFRSAFPVNRFSANYRRREPLVRVADAGTPMPERSAGTTAVSSFRVRRLYRLKKAQYVFLKHVLQHGLNVGVVVAAARASSAGVVFVGGHFVFPRVLAHAKHSVRHGVLHADAGQEKEALATNDAAHEQNAHVHELPRRRVRRREGVARRRGDVVRVERALAGARIENGRARARRGNRRRRDVAPGMDRVSRFRRRANLRGGGKTHQGVGGKK